MSVTLLEPYFGGSHRQWAEGYIAHTTHNITLLTLPAQAWKWRMQGGAITLARAFSAHPTPDAVLASGMMNVATFRALTGYTGPLALYLHENQLTYPQNSRQHHGWRYGFVNYISALAADQLLFNSRYHLEAFFNELPRMLKHFYDLNELDTIEPLRQRAAVLPVGIDLTRYDTHQSGKKADQPPLIVWNHRWEEDKNPAAFFRALEQLISANVEFRVAIVGEQTAHNTTAFQAIRDKLGPRLVAYGYQPHFADYARLLWEADYVVSTAIQEFFGVSVVEAIYCGCTPILPHRLNYPHLLPTAAHNTCLYRGDHALAGLLLRHLRGETALNTNLQPLMAQYNWSQLAPRYDATLTHLAQRPLKPRVPPPPDT
jgi:glycosyltransferase involved in cell wall biosynthesis